MAERNPVASGDHGAHVLCPRSAPGVCAVCRPRHASAAAARAVACRHAHHRHHPPRQLDAALATLAAQLERETDTAIEKARDLVYYLDTGEAESMWSAAVECARG